MIQPGAIAILGDVHGNLAAFEAVLAATRGVEAYVFLGDYVGYGPQPREVLALTRDLAAGHRLASVIGNHDRYALAGEHSWDGVEVTSGGEWEAWTSEQLSAQDRAFLEALPGALTIELPMTCGASVTAHVEHNLPGAHRYLRPDTPEEEIAPMVSGRRPALFLFGHSHVVMDRTIGGKRIVNPGSVGQPRDGSPDAAYALWRPEGLTFHRLAYDVDRTVSALEALPMSREQTALWTRNLRQGIVIAASRPDLEADGPVELAE